MGDASFRQAIVSMGVYLMTHSLDSTEMRIAPESDNQAGEWPEDIGFIHPQSELGLALADGILCLNEGRYTEVTNSKEYLGSILLKVKSELGS